MIRLVDMLVALTISEDAIYPLIQSYVWAKIGAEPKVLKRVLDSFIRVRLSSREELRAGECVGIEGESSCYSSDFARYCVYTSLRMFVACSGYVHLKRKGVCAYNIGHNYRWVYRMVWAVVNLRC